MALMNLIMLYQEKIQDIQEFRDKHMAKVCNELGLKFVRCKDDMKAVLNENGINEITNAQLKKSA